MTGVFHKDFTLERVFIYELICASKSYEHSIFKSVVSYFFKSRKIIDRNQLMI